MTVIAWNDFEINAPNSFRRLWNEKSFTDVTLATSDGHQIKAHKFLLSSCSEFFQNILKENPHQNLLLYLKGINYSELEMILKFIYTGQCELPEDELETFLNGGADLRVKGLIGHSIEPKQHNSLSGVDHEQKEHIINSAEADLITNNTDNEALEQTKEKITEIKNSVVAFEIENPSINEMISKLTCGQCEFKGARASDVTRHIKLKHLGVRFDCKKCEARFTDKKNLVRHEQSRHEGIKYECDVCGKMLSQKSHMTMHGQIQHERTWR